MKNGMVTNGRTTTLYGNTATQWLANQSAAFVASKDEAIEKIRSAGGNFRECLIVAFRARGFDIPEELVEQLREEEAEKERQVVARVRAAKAAEWRAEPLIPATTRSLCKRCDQPIKKGEVCHERETKKGSKTLRSRVHSQCVEEPKG